MPKRLLYSLALAALLLTIVSAYFATGIRVEQDNESMQSKQARTDPVYTQFNRMFDAEYELMLTITRKDLDAKTVQPAIDWLRGLTGVKQVYAPSLSDASSGFISKDHQTAGLLVTLQAEQSREDRLKMLNTLRIEAPKQIDGTVRVVGLPLLKERVANHISRDQSVVIPLSILVMTVMLAGLFRRAAGVALPMAVVGMSLISTLGFYAACGFQLNSITSLLPPVVIVLSVSVAVHLFDAWNHAINTGTRGDEAIRSAVSNVWKPCVFTAAMTAAGLLSLCFSPVPAVRLFGIFSAAGVTLSVFFAFSIFPVALGWVKARPSHGKITLMSRFLHCLTHWTGRYPAAILTVALLISLVSLWSGSSIENNTDLIRFFKKSDPTYIAYADVNRTLGSVRALDLLVQRTDAAAFNPLADLEPLDRFVENVGNIPDVVRVDSIVDFFKREPTSPAVDAQPLIDRFMADEGKIIRVQVHLDDIGSARAADICNQIQIDAQAILGEGWMVQPTGAYYQMVRDSNQLVSTLVKSFAMTLAIVMASTCLLFRSIRVLIPAFIPNILPIIWGAGLMGALGIDLSTGTAMVAAVVIGLAVDDTIHYLHHFQAFRHLPIREATRSTTLRIGSALTASSIVLVGGFWMGAFGSFIPTNTFALLTGCMMVSALFCDLLVLPAYLNLTTKDAPYA